jgi:hypothetical protein
MILIRCSIAIKADINVCVGDHSNLHLPSEDFLKPETGV